EHVAGEEGLVRAQGQAFRREVEGRRGAERHGSHHHERGEQQRVDGDRERPEEARRAAAHRAVSSRARRREAQSARPTSPSIKSARFTVKMIPKWRWSTPAWVMTGISRGVRIRLA